MRRIREVLRLRAELGTNRSAIAAGARLARSTVRAYLPRAAAAVALYLMGLCFTLCGMRNLAASSWCGATQHSRDRTWPASASSID
jgi:hypothetical protein